MQVLHRCLLLLLLLSLAGSCREGQSGTTSEKATTTAADTLAPSYATGFTAITNTQGYTELIINEPWPGADRSFRYALVPDSLQTETYLAAIAGLRAEDESLKFDGIVGVPITSMVLTSTTHIPALEALGTADALVGFPGLDYISSTQTRERISKGLVTELGANEQLNTELVLQLQPEALIGFAVSEAPKSYELIENSGIPVLYNGDWNEATPLAKAEWIKFFGLLLDRQEEANAHFAAIEEEYLRVRSLARQAAGKPTVLSGALYRDVWYLPGGKSWAAQFVADAQGQYLWANTPQSGSLSLSLEVILEQGESAEFWIAPSQFTSYSEMLEANPHYDKIKAFQLRQVYGYADSRGPTGGLLYFELGPNRPDLILKDLVFHLHPGLLTDYEPVFFKPLKP
ncbi:iron complex transport system substrate-binding protein [Robiginitalea myxolifaciens]|uniref:Iron complex transport system substrate-binding protein n=1 Tax=Robiginitalea myxolifaciens TaxID=400055 RepID=A0A1I6FMV2_9FLAO|nr:ABC transporter substrate-binding protein [Robiginitalea myxolifaciens]SFR31208.1 iron complex transport system substrate-binding protein [Robiginitalea myxolifaciens]